MLFLNTLKARAGALKGELVALALAARHPETPWYVKVLILVVVAYALSPIDLIPDFIPVLGYLDDLVLVPLGIMLALRGVPPDVMEQCRLRAATVTAKAKRIGWIAAGVIVIFWLLMGTWLVRTFATP